MLRYRLGVIDVIERAAAVPCGAGALKFGEATLIPELHGEAHDSAALLLQERGNGGRVDAAGHGDGHEAAPGLGALGKGVELGYGRHAFKKGAIDRAPAASFYPALATFRYAGDNSRSWATAAGTTLRAKSRSAEVV